MGRQSRVASAPSTTVVAVTSKDSSGSCWPSRTPASVSSVVMVLMNAPSFGWCRHEHGALLVRFARSARSSRSPPVAEAGVRLDPDQLVVLVAVLHVDDPEAAGAELRRLLLAHGPEDLRGAQAVARSHRL